MSLLSQDTHCSTPPYGRETRRDDTEKRIPRHQTAGEEINATLFLSFSPSAAAGAARTENCSAPSMVFFSQNSVPRNHLPRIGLQITEGASQPPHASARRGGQEKPARGRLPLPSTGPTVSYRIMEAAAAKGSQVVPVVVSSPSVWCGVLWWDSCDSREGHAGVASLGGQGSTASGRSKAAAAKGLAAALLCRPAPRPWLGLPASDPPARQPEGSERPRAAGRVQTDACTLHAHAVVKALMITWSPRRAAQLVRGKPEACCRSAAFS